MNHCQLWAQKCLSEIKLHCQLHSIQPNFSHSKPLIYFSEEYFSSSELPFCNTNVPLACILLWQTLNESKSLNHLLCFYVNLNVQRLMLRPLLMPLSSLGIDFGFCYFFSVLIQHELRQLQWGQRLFTQKVSTLMLAV